MNKRIIILLVCLLLIIIPTVLLSAVFIVRDIDVVKVGDEPMTIDKDKIIADSMLKKHSSIFAMSEKNISHNIELKNPYVKVIDIERIVPDKVVVSVVQRVALFAVAISGTSKYALVDRELKVVEIVDNLIDHNVVDYSKSYTLKMDSNTSLDNTIIYLDKNNKDDPAAMVISEIIRAFEDMKYPNHSFTSMVDSVVNDFKKQKTTIKTTMGASIEVIVPSTVGVYNLLINGLNVFFEDMKSEDRRVNTTRGIYKFDTSLEVPAWVHID